MVKARKNLKSLYSDLKYLIESLAFSRFQVRLSWKWGEKSIIAVINQMSTHFPVLIVYDGVKYEKILIDALYIKNTCRRFLIVHLYKYLTL